MEKITGFVDEHVPKLLTSHKEENLNTENDSNNFKDYVTQKFNLSLFKVKRKPASKYINGRISQRIKDPDLLVDYLGETNHTFGVECKWKESLVDNGFMIGTDWQLTHYKEYEMERKIPVFIVLGLGGKSDSPEHLFLLPLNLIKFNFITAEYLFKFIQPVESVFALEGKNKVLNLRAVET